MYNFNAYCFIAVFLFCNPQMIATQNKDGQTHLSEAFANHSSDYILWDSKKPLRIKDFRGSIKNKLNNAETVSFISYSLLVDDAKNILSLQVSANFDGEESYFKHSDEDLLVLAHEQLHFDITEIHARLFFKKLLETKLTKSDFRVQVSDILKEIEQDLIAKQDQYDAQIDGNPHLQSLWNGWVAEELQELSAYHLKRARIKLN